MGITPSKRAQKQLQKSPAFNSAIAEAFKECTNLTLHSIEGLHLYQMSHACSLVYQTLTQTLSSSAACNDPLYKIRSRCLTNPPSRVQIDRTLAKLELNENSEISFEEFKELCLVLYRDIILSECRGAAILGFAIAVSSLLIARRINMFQSLNLGNPKIITACAVGAATSSYYCCC
eukprot:TRINITY_DN10034_c0_g1_i2.p1 TRINITY_DN10034_c0_g1~~TRINITY_DN10034_c0_g1_i2.p1  ORF type:complete len:176 (+),score=1.69 TRINITY_DN10034_c0_g1_i2:136-663(+)